MFSTFWAFQIFITKLGLLAGGLVLPFQLAMTLAAFLATVVLLLQHSGVAFIDLFKNQPGLFWQLFLANGIQSGLGTSLSIIGIALTDTINAGFLVKVSTVTTILFAWVFLKENLSRLKVIVVFVMLGGAYLLTTKGQSLVPRVGDLLILGACACWSSGTVMVRKILKTQAVPADVITLQKPVASITVFSGLIAVLVLFPRLFGDLGDISSCCSLPSRSLPYAIISGAFLAMTWIYLFRTLNIATASYMTLVSMVTPVIVSALAMIFLRESLNWVQIIGVAMILVSGVAVSLGDIVSG
jgi:drug/metabolite transporter (DMT)-like permease